MESITYRQLQTSFPKDLPVLITRYSIPFAKIVEIDPKHVTVRDNVTVRNGNNLTVTSKFHCIYEGCDREQDFKNIKKGDREEFACGSHIQIYTRQLGWEEI
jgi:hypothetical protein